jgi:hypothetical protein
VDPDSERLTVTVSGLSNSWSVEEGGEVRREVLRLHFRREEGRMRFVPPAVWLIPKGSPSIPRDRRRLPEGGPRVDPVEGGPLVAPAGPPQGKEDKPEAVKQVTVQVRFGGPLGATLSQYGQQGPAEVFTAPARFPLAAGVLYRMKLSKIPSCPGLDLYPTVEIPAANAKTAEFLAHSSVPISFTPEEIELARDGTFLMKVIYLPESGDDADAKPLELVSKPKGVADPIVEARRRGQILAVVRLGDLDLESKGK